MMEIGDVMIRYIKYIPNLIVIIESFFLLIWDLVLLLAFIS